MTATAIATTATELYGCTSGKGKTVHLTTSPQGTAMRPGDTLCGRDAHHVYKGANQAFGLAQANCGRCAKRAEAFVETPAPEAPVTKRTLRATLPCGTEATRTTARAYGLVLAVRTDDDRWAAYRWTRDQNTAATGVAEAARAGYSDVRLVPVAG